MLINLNNSVEYLINTSLITTKSIIESDLKIIDISRMNKNIKVIRENDVSYIIKQPSSLTHNSYGNISIEREGNIYKLIQENDFFYSIRMYLPRFCYFDKEQHILITELIPNSITLFDLFRKSHSDPKLALVFHDLGKAIGQLHSIFAKCVNDEALNEIPRMRYPNVIIYKPDPTIFVNLSKANLQLLKLVQKFQEFHHKLGSFYECWETKTLIHGDMKWDNILVFANSSTGKEVSTKPNLCIIDWEICRFGDPAWDLGGIFHDFISFWISSFVNHNKGENKNVSNTLRYPLDSMKNLIRLFWNQYVNATSLDNVEANNLLRRSTVCCAIRLLQRTYEIHKSSEELSNYGIYLTQTSLNILEKVDDAIIHLFGIPFKMHHD